MERIENPGAEDTEQSEGAEVVRLWPISVLLVSPDRCWRSTVAMLTGRRDRPALSAEDEREAIEIASRERVDVIVVERPASENPRSWDAYVHGLVASIGLAMAQQGARVAPVGVVVVSEPPRPGGRRSSRWSSTSGGPSAISSARSPAPTGRGACPANGASCPGRRRCARRRPIERRAERGPIEARRCR